MCPIYAIQSPVYMPVMRQIVAITQDFPASVTTSFNHGYVDGTIVRMYVPQEWGMIQINQQVGDIVVTGPTSFAINIDTRNYYPFIVPVIQIEIAQVIPIGSEAHTYEPAIHNRLR